MSTQAAETGPDPHTTAGKLADLERRRHEAVHAGSEQAWPSSMTGARKTARERIDMLLDPGSFTEFDRAGQAPVRTTSAIEANRPYGDGVVTGYGTVDGRPVCVFSQDFTVFGGSLGEGLRREDRQGHGSRAKDRLPDHRDQRRRRRRIQEGVVALGLFAEIFYRNVMASAWCRRSR